MNPSIAIILGYFNGSAHIKEQLNSIFEQTYANFDLYIFDDCSESHHSNFVKQLCDIGDNVFYFRNKENLGFSKNFLDGISRVKPDYEYYAFSDQDDIWFPDKLERAVTNLRKRRDKPALYCSSTEIVDKNLNLIRKTSPIFSKKPGFGNAFLQNIGGGNTMVMNKKARDLVVKTTLRHDMPSHDWWSYILISGVGGEVVYDRDPTLKYRQHSSNLIGTNLGVLSKINRIRNLLNGEYKSWIDRNLKAINHNIQFFSPENQKMVKAFLLLRKKPVYSRLAHFLKLGIKRQYWFENIALLIAITFKRL